MTVYLDLLMLLNFGVDYLLLLGTQRFLQSPVHHGRLLAAAVLGAAYSGICLVPGFRFLGAFHWRLVFLGGMCWIAFGFRRSTLQRAGIFCLLSLALGGMANLVAQGNSEKLLLCALALCLGCRMFLGCAEAKGGLVPLCITLGERSLSLTALRDTGNALRDPITGEKVLIVGQPEAEKLTGLTSRELQNPMQTLVEHPVCGLRLIPYHAVGKSGGMLLGMRIREVTIDGVTAPTVVAFAPNRLGNDEYQALVGGKT